MEPRPRKAPAMAQAADIREKTCFRHEDIAGLNFIRDNPGVVFRRHHRTGLRSHVVEVIPRHEMEKERTGVVKDGVRIFPGARPAGMLRIFKARFAGVDEVLAEIGRVRLVEIYLTRRFAALSTEFVADYRKGGRGRIVLCGFQTYVEGRILDPWGDHCLEHLCPFDPHDPVHAGTDLALWREQTARNLAGFVESIIRMVRRGGHIPDLAGVGNLVITPAAEVRLVDINNVTPVYFDDEIRLDDKGYPVTDRSVEALYLLETRLLGRKKAENRPLYRTFLTKDRKSRVQELAAGFPGYAKNS